MRVTVVGGSVPTLPSPRSLPSPLLAAFVSHFWRGSLRARGDHARSRSDSLQKLGGSAVGFKSSAIGIARQKLGVAAFNRDRIVMERRCREKKVTESSLDDVCCYDMPDGVRADTLTVFDVLLRPITHHYIKLIEFLIWMVCGNKHKL